MYLPGLHPGQTLPNFFSPLAHHIETLFLTGKPPYPVERTLLTTGILAAAIESLQPGAEADRHASPRGEWPTSRPGNRPSAGAEVR